MPTQTYDLPRKVELKKSASRNIIDVLPNDINALADALNNNASELDTAATGLDTATIDLAARLAGGNVLLTSGTQTGSDAPTINAPSGRVTTASTSTAGLATKTVTITNSFATAASIIFVSIGSYGGNGAPIVKEVTPGSGSIVVEILNSHLTVALSAAMDLNFAIVG